jgi:UDP-2-acetamido-3-amino-2,3-dideoxy-glucuronate N-acetyltransferase
LTHENAAAATRAATAPPDPPAIGFRSTSVAGVTLHRMPFVDDPRGLLTFGEIGEQVPFEVKRYFLVFGVSSAEIRGEHAHRELHQFLICVHGCCHLAADDGRNREDFRLDNPSVGVHLPPMVWGVQHNYTHDGVLLVLASAKYDPADYIRDYAEFLRLVKGR